MNYNPKVSIVIPAFNAANYLSEAIDSALAQTYENIEIIVVNDGSNDDGATRSVALQYGDKIRYFEKPNGGSSSALNHGINQITGEWFSWLSHDDLYYPDKIKKQIECLNNIAETAYPIRRHVIFTSGNLINENGQIIKKSNTFKANRVANEIENMRGNHLLIADPRTYSFNGCSCLINKSVFTEIGNFNENLRLINDLDMWYRIFKSGYKIHFIPEALVSSRIHEKQVSRTIGYSTQNPEQTFYLNRSMEWLFQNCPSDYKALYRFARMAYLGRNLTQGDVTASRIKKNSVRLRLKFYKHLWRGYAMLRSICKKIYIKIRL